MGLESESERGDAFGGLSDGLHESAVGVGVFELDGLDLTSVVEISDELVVRFVLGEVGLGDQVEGALVVLVVEVVSQQQVQ